MLQTAATPLEITMAKQKDASDLLHEITCSLCLDIYQEPKRLPCDHVYCRGCLEGLANHSRNGAITCPECRRVAQVANNDVATTFTTAFQVNRLKELYAKQQKRTVSEKGDIKQQEVTECQIHKQPIALYCETCDELICRDCLIATTTHKTHEYAYVAASAEKYRQSISAELESKQQLEASLSTALAKVKDTKAAIAAQGEALEGEIDTKFQLLADKLLEEKAHLKRKVGAEIQDKTLRVASQEASLNNAHAELTETIGLARQASQEFSDMQLVSDQRKVTQGLKTAVRNIWDLSLEPVDEPNIRCKTITPEQLQNACRPLNIMFTMADPRKCQAEGQGLTYADIDKQTIVILHLADNKGQPSIDTPPIEVRLTNIKEGSSMMGTVAPKSQGQYAITYEAPQRGRHTLSITVSGSHVTGSPFSVYVNKPPTTFAKPVTRIGPLNYPAGLAWSNGKLYVGEHNADRVLVFDHTLNLTQTIEHRELLTPGEIAVDKEHNVYASTGASNKLHKFNKDGEHLKQVGGFNFANGNRISSQNELCVCDTEHSKIKVYDTDLNLQRTVTLKSNPYDLHLDDSKNLYITYTKADRIQVLTFDGRPRYQIGKKGSKPGQLNMPVSLQIAGDLLYVTECGNNRVSVFRTSGEFVTTFGEGHLFQPEGIAIDEDGYVYVTSHNENVLVF